MRLTPKGMIRWYTNCCKTPVGNTISASFPFIGIIHNFMDDTGRRDQNIGPVRAYVQGQYATGLPPNVSTHPKFPLGITMRIMKRMLVGKLTGKSRPNPLFNEDGSPISDPDVRAD